jgi:ribosome-binding protein aMBF1 (putative translation factor)
MSVGNAREVADSPSFARNQPNSVIVHRMPPSKAQVTREPRGSNLKTMCLAAGISQAELSRRAKVSADTVRTAERRGDAVKELTLWKILNAFNELASEKHQTELDLMFPLDR